jgi:putative glycosyltransferase
MKLSIVTTLYFSANYIEEFVARACRTAEAVCGSDYEVVLVNDGSPDDSLTLSLALRTTFPRVRIIDLSRNFGHHKAIMTGLSQAHGELVYLIDCDLEEQPEWLAEFHRELPKLGADVVYGIQVERKGNWFERSSGFLFYMLFEKLTGLAIPYSSVTARLMSRRYVVALLRHQEREIFLAGLWHITGFRQCPIRVTKRSKGQSTYTFQRKLSLFVNAVTSFSNTPLVMIFYFGIGILLLASGFIAYLVVYWLFLASPPSGWTSLIASIWFLGGLIISFIGILGLYLSKVYSESKQRPYTIVRETHGN